MNKKLIFLILINIFIFIFLFFTVDYLIYKNYCKEQKAFDPNNLYPPSSYFHLVFNKNQIGITVSEIDKEYKDDFSYIVRKNLANSRKYTKPSIILFGCSYTYGTFLEEKQTLGYKLTNLTKRNVYNEGIEACGIQCMNFLLNQDFFYQHISPAPKYAIYIYIPNHLERLTSKIFPSPLTCNNYISFKLKKDNLILNKESKFLYRFFIFKKFFKQTDYKNNEINKENNYKKFMLANELFLSSKSLLEKHFPDIKFVILKINIEEDSGENYELPFMWDVLKKEGFIIINTEELLDRKYKLNSEDTVIDGNHPSEKFLNQLAPALVKKLNL